MIFVALLYSVLLAAAGYIMLTQAKELVPWFEPFLNSQLNLHLGTLALLPFALAGVWFHNDWTLGPGLAVTVIAWVSLVELLVLLLLPSFMRALIDWWLKRGTPQLWLRLEGALLLVLGVLGLWHTYNLTQMMHSMPAGG